MVVSGLIWLSRFALATAEVAATAATATKVAASDDATQHYERL
jgi:hypothetical protein